MKERNTMTLPKPQNCRTNGTRCLHPPRSLLGSSKLSELEVGHAPCDSWTEHSETKQPITIPRTPLAGLCNKGSLFMCTVFKKYATSCFSLFNLIFGLRDATRYVAFFVFEFNLEINLKKELRGRKINITRSMDAEERFHNKRMENVEYYIHMKHSVPLEPINTNWTMKYVSINGQIVVKTVQIGNLKYIKYQDVEAEVVSAMFSMRCELEPNESDMSHELHLATID